MKASPYLTHERCLLFVSDSSVFVSGTFPCLSASGYDVDFLIGFHIKRFDITLISQNYMCIYCFVVVVVVLFILYGLS